MSMAIAIKAEFPILQESKHLIIILPNSQPVKDAINLIKNRKFLTRPRMNRFLSNMNKITIIVKHLSRKYNLNNISDHQSHHLSECKAESCSIHKFINELSNTVLDPSAKSASIKADSSFFNRAA